MPTRALLRANALNCQLFGLARTDGHPCACAQVYATAWRRCGIDSMIVPTTQKWMINHLGFFYVLKYPQAVGELRKYTGGQRVKAATCPSRSALPSRGGGGNWTTGRARGLHRKGLQLFMVGEHACCVLHAGPSPHVGNCTQCADADGLPLPRQGRLHR